ncbi:MAG: tRNA 2-thiouridine(34) synthase MnmA [Myxococcota bacterium]
MGNDPKHSTRGRVVVAMSGGVDSSVAAALLVEQGFDVVGVTMHLWDAPAEQRVGRCCAPEDRDDARRVADHLGIPHYVVDERTSFRTHVVEPFMDSYLRGETPSPCVHCNRTVKLTFLADLADQFGADRVATGHYVRLEDGPTGPVLRRGRDLQKDQSYFLFGVPKRTLACLMFPLGEMVKDEARQHGRRLGVPNADKPDSQELCFVPDGDVHGFIAERRGTPRGPMVDEAGTVLREHAGVTGFTVGQRKGLGLGGGPPRYVLRILDNAVVVGGEDKLYQRELHAVDAAWQVPLPDEAFRADVRIRYRHDPAPATVTPTRDGFHAVFDEPQRAITPGQAAVVYNQGRVVAGGFIVGLPATKLPTAESLTTESPTSESKTSKATESKTTAPE